MCFQLLDWCINTTHMEPQMWLVSVFWDMLKIWPNIKRTKSPLLFTICLLSRRWRRWQRRAVICSSCCRVIRPRRVAVCLFAFLENRSISYFYRIVKFVSTTNFFCCWYNRVFFSQKRWDDFQKQVEKQRFLDYVF